MIQNILRFFFVVNLLMAYACARSAYSYFPSEYGALFVAVFGFFVLHMVLIALQFMLSAIANRGLAGMSVIECLRAYAAEFRYSWLTFAWRQPWRAQADQDLLFDEASPSINGKRGVLFVHGYFCNRGLWRGHMAQLSSHGVPHIAITLEPAFGSITSYAQPVHEAVEKLYAATGLAPVLVCHSMGGLAARAYIAQHGSERVERVITIGTPHHGTFHASLGHGKNTKEMRLVNAWRDANAAALNSTARAKFVCFYSNGDNIVAPFESAMFEGAQNHCISATGHVALAFAPEVSALLDKVIS